MKRGVQFDPAKDIAPVDFIVTMNNSELFEAANAEIVARNSLFALGQEAIQRAVIENQKEASNPMMLGARLYSVLYRLADPDNALNGSFRPGYNVDSARKAAQRIIPGSRREYWDLLLKARGDMDTTTPGNYAFFLSTIHGLTIGEVDASEKTHDVIYGVALMNRVHRLGERALLPPWQRIFRRV